MIKKMILLALCSLLLAPCSAADAQQPKKVTRIGYLSTFDPATDFARFEAIQLALRELGYIEGQNIAIEQRYAEGKVDWFPELAAELMLLKVDIVVIALDKQRLDGVYVFQNPRMTAHRTGIVKFAIKRRLPSVYSNREAVDAGGLMYYGADIADSYRRIAVYVDRILKGVKPSDLLSSSRQSSSW